MRNYYNLPLDEGYYYTGEERWVKEPPKSRLRSEFQRDRARLIHASSFRRLGEKTQVQMAGSDDFSRTRLTHSLEVAQIGRQMGALLGCDPDVVDCACLAHDLGHPPFGHNGEEVLARYAADIGGFEGNAQTLRLLTRLEPKIFSPEGVSAGLNLTRASLDAVIKYPWTYADARHKGTKERTIKFCVYPDQEEVFHWIKKGAPAENRRPIETQVMDIADDIAYSTHDVEDSIVKGLFVPSCLYRVSEVENIIQATRDWYGTQWDAQLLEEALRTIGERFDMHESEFISTRENLARVKNVTSHFIGDFEKSIVYATEEKYGERPLIRYEGDIVIPQKTQYGIMALKGCAIYAAIWPKLKTIRSKEEQHVLSVLVETMAESGKKPSPLLEPQYREDFLRADSDAQRLRAIIDQVASLTDVSALALYNHLVGR